MQGYKSNINEVVFFLDVLSAGQNKLPMFHPWGTGNPDFFCIPPALLSPDFIKNYIFSKKILTSPTTRDKLCSHPDGVADKKSRDGAVW